MDETLRLPESFTRLDEEEQSALEGGCLIRPSTWCYTVFVMLRPGSYSEPTDAERQAFWLQREHGDIVRLRYGSYTYADGYVYKLPKDPDRYRGFAGFFLSAGDFFDGIGL